MPKHPSRESAGASYRPGNCGIVSQIFFCNNALADFPPD
jgi:hypothetical protein